MFCSITRNEIISILTQDSHYRKYGKWELLTSNDFLNKNYHDFEVIDMLNMMLNMGYEKDKNKTKTVTLKQFRDNISISYPMINEILSKFHGHIVACGGSISNIITDVKMVNNKPIDIYIFFYDLNIEQANQMRIDIIEMIIDKSVKAVRNYRNFAKYCVERNEYVTSVCIYLNDQTNEVIEYQLIHRIYPDISSIIGGFDIGVCMVAYDGQEVYSTPLGMWSIINRSIIVDTKRRSTSYEHRLVKYYRRGYRIIFPGLDNYINNRFVLGSASETKEELKLKIEKLIEMCGYTISDLDSIINKCEQRHNKYISDQNLIVKEAYNKKYLDLTKYSGLTQKSLNNMSDYGRYYRNILFRGIYNANVTKLRFGNLNSVVSILSDINGDIKQKLLDDIDNPTIGLNNNTISHYLIKAHNARYYNDRKNWNWENIDYYRILACFGSYTNIVIKIRDTDEYLVYVDKMIEIMKENNKICIERLKGIKWITENPGRQWTASINPIVADPREWYGDKYIPVQTGIPVEIESCLRLSMLPGTNSILSYLPKEIFERVLFYVHQDYADKAWKYII
jgi:hypothetical protein